MSFRIAACLIILLTFLTSCIAVPVDGILPDISPSPEASASLPSTSPPPADDSPPPTGEDSLEPEAISPGELNDDGISSGSVYRVQANDYLSLRVSPNSESLRMEKLLNGTLVIILESLDDFVRVVTQDGQRGYVMSDYLVLTQESAFEIPQCKLGPHTVICQNYISLRESASTTACSIAKLEPYDHIEVLSVEGDFAYVYAESIDTHGYVLYEYLNYGTFNAPKQPEPTEDPGSEIDIWIAACSEYISLRQEPDIDSERLLRIQKGEQVELLDYSGMFAKVSYMNEEGYVLSGYLARPGEQDYERELKIVNPSSSYGYQQMQSDLNELRDKYTDKLSIESIGQSELGRDIPVAIVGSKDAGKHVLIQAAIHGRENMTAALVMAQVEYMLSHGGDAFGDGTVSDALGGVCFHIIPMSNPDGVEISIGSIINQDIEDIYNKDIYSGYTNDSMESYLQCWKANANGVDINRNFDAMWYDLEGRPLPSSERFKGQEPENQKETIALVEYTKLYGFDATISYHAYGSEIYWSFGDDGNMNAASRDLGRSVRSITGYPLDGGEGLDSGGFKDWAMDTMGIPSLTIEVGTRQTPLPLDEFATIWDRNKLVPAAIARWVKGR